jgi:hypothetical protein
MGAAGGSQSMQTHSHGITDPTHVHLHGTGSQNIFGSWDGVTGGAFNLVQYSGSGQPFATFAPGSVAAAFTGITVNNQGAGTAQNVQPTIVSFLPLIRAA